MNRRSSLSRWSRPATGKQIAALKSHGNYDGKYYSMGRASQAIGRGSAGGGSRANSGFSDGSAYSPLAASGLGASRSISQLLKAPLELDSLLKSGLGTSQSSLAVPGNGASNLLSQLLGVPGDIDSLMEAALDAAGREESGRESEGGSVESVLYTIRADDSSPGESHIAVEAEVIRARTFDGKPSLQVRFVGTNVQDGSATVDLSDHLGSPLTLGYRPRWTPELVRTPAELAEQMRIRWQEALDELREGVDPRMTTFLEARGMQTALAVLTSNQSPTSKFVLLQGLMDPEGQIQFKGLALDAPTFAGQIRAAHEGDEDSLSWLEEVQREEVLTSFSEVTGISLAAEADFRLSRWQKQGMDLIDAVTINAEDAGTDFSRVRQLFLLRAQTLPALERAREQLAAAEAASEAESVVSGLARRVEFYEAGRSSDDYGIPEDWFFEETRVFLRTCLRESLPWQFAAALVPTSPTVPRHAVLATEVRRLATTSSLEPKDYMPYPNIEMSSSDMFQKSFSNQTNHSGKDAARRVERILQAVRRVIADSETAGDDDLGTFIVANEVLGYAKWKRDELRAEGQLREAESHRSAAVQRAQEAERRAETARQREKLASRNALAANGLEQIVQRYSNALERTSGPIAIDDSQLSAAQSDARARSAEAQLRQTAASERLTAAVESEQWATAAVSAAATKSAEVRLLSERDLAVAEQSEARAEQTAAMDEETQAQSDLRMFASARADFAELIRDVRAENNRRVLDQLERDRQEAATAAKQRRLQAEQQRLRAEKLRNQKEAALQRQAAFNQWQRDRADAAKTALRFELDRLLALPDAAPFWRRKALAESKAAVLQEILRLQAQIVGPLTPPQTGSKTWPNMLSRGERYLGTVKKLADYGAFVSLPASTDGLLRGAESSDLNEPGQLVLVEIVDMPYGKPIVLRRVVYGPAE